MTASRLSENKFISFQDTVRHRDICITFEFLNSMISWFSNHVRQMAPARNGIWMTFPKIPREP